MLQKTNIDVINAIDPVNAGTGAAVLLYDRINPAFQEYKKSRWQIYSSFLKTAPGSIEESLAVNEMVDAGLVRSSYMTLHTSRHNRSAWAERFTQLSKSLYGEPDPIYATQLLKREQQFVESLLASPLISKRHAIFLIDSYRQIAAVGTVNYGEQLLPIMSDHTAHAIRHYGMFIQRRYRPVFDLVDLSNKTVFSAHDLFNIFDSALRWMQQHDDDDWRAWRVVSTDKVSIYVSDAKKQICIGARREPATAEEARGLLAHELLVHALRSKNGYKTGNRLLATGPPGYLSAEEGLGVLNEMAVNNFLPDKARDRYLDIALALGTIDGIKRSRKQIYKISYARNLIRAQSKGLKPEAIKQIKPKTWAHVDRIYRGGLGFGRDSQAIFTKDIVYFVGLLEMADYIAHRIYKGELPETVFTHISSAKFDPNNPKHLDMLRSVSV